MEHWIWSDVVAPHPPLGHSLPQQGTRGSNLIFTFAPSLRGTRRTGEEDISGLQ
jgi:hypothetical protein